MHAPHQHTAEGNIRLAFFTNLLFTLIEFVGGFLTHSMSIVSESVHDLGCTLTLGLSWLFEKKDHAFTGAVVGAVVLVVSSIVVIAESIGLLTHPEEVSADGMLWVALLGIAFKGFAVWKTHHGHDANERMVSLHLLGDCLGWVVVLACSIVLKYHNIPWLDAALSIAISLFVLYGVIYNLWWAIQEHSKQANEGEKAE